MEINGNQLTLYIGGEPVIVCNDPIMPDRAALEADILRTCEEHTWTFQSSKFQELKLTPQQLWNYNWWMARTLPRKQKKAYRKKLIKMLYGN